MTIADDRPGAIRDCGPCPPSSRDASRRGRPGMSLGYRTSVRLVTGSEAGCIGSPAWAGGRTSPVGNLSPACTSPARLLSSASEHGSPPLSGEPTPHRRRAGGLAHPLGEAGRSPGRPRARARRSSATPGTPTGSGRRARSRRAPRRRHRRWCAEVGCRRARRSGDAAVNASPTPGSSPTSSSTRRSAGRLGPELGARGDRGVEVGPEGDGEP